MSEVFDRETLLAAVHTAAEIQASLQGRAYTAVGRKAVDHLADASLQGLADLREDNRAVNFQVVSMPTGYGKSTSAVAFIVAMAKVDPSFSAAYVCRERELAEKVGNDIDTLSKEVLGIGIATVYTEAHATSWDRVTEAQRYRDAFRFVPNRPVTYKSALPSARVVVVTHAAWRSEVERGSDTGILNHMGRRRLVFVDEAPDLVRIVELQSARVQDLHDAVVRTEGDTPLARRLAEASSDLADIMRTSDKSYAVPAITRLEDAELFGSLLGRPGRLAPFVGAATGPRSLDTRSAYEAVARFFVAASRGCMFYSTAGRSFWAYEFAVQPGPGHVLMDATADLGSIVSFMPGAARPAVQAPAVDYRRLSIVHVQTPKDFKRVADVVAKASTGTAYGQWMREVIAATVPVGETALVVAPMAVFDQEFFPAARDPKRPVEVDGRKVVTLHWGSGIGANDYRDIRYVVQFGEWFLPRGATVSEVQGYRSEPVDAAELSLAVGRKTAGGEYSARGAFGQAAQNHLLRWSAQLSARGNVRNIDADGVCGEMVLVTTMNRARLLKNINRLFPGASRPQSLLVPLQDAKAVRASNREALADLLATTSADLLTFTDIARTGIRRQDLRREFNAETVQVVAGMYGWRLATNREVGLPGKGLVLVRGDLVASRQPNQEFRINPIRASLL